MAAAGKESIYGYSSVYACAQAMLSTSLRTVMLS